MLQAGTSGNTIYLDNKINVMFSWRLHETANASGRVFFYGIWVQTVGNLPSGTFARSQGVITLPNSGGTDPGKSFVSPAALWWEQNFSNGIRYRVGQMWATNLWSNNVFCGDDRATCTNSLMGGGAGVSGSGGNRGPGATIVLERDWGYLAVGFQD